MVLPAVRGVRRLLSGLLPVLSDVRIWRLVQPVDGCIRSRRRVVRAVRRRWSRRAIQPGDGHLRARRGGVGSVRRARRRGSVQPSHGHVCAHAAGIGRLRELGLDFRAARQSVGADLARDESLHGDDDTRDAGQRPRPSDHEARTGSGDVYAGRDGNVYRRQEGGGWEQWNGGGWSSGDKPTPRDGSGTAGTTNRAGTNDTVGQLDRDRAARTEGATRTRDYGTTRTSPAPRTSSGSGYGGSYRTGGMRGGGGGRRR